MLSFVRVSHRLTTSCMYPITIVKLLGNLKWDTHLRNHDHGNQRHIKVKTLHFDNIFDPIVSVVGDYLFGRVTLHKSTVTFVFSCFIFFSYDDII